MNTAWIFPGQGSQRIGMGEKLVDFSPLHRAAFQQAEEILHLNLENICFRGPQNLLLQTTIAQPALLTVNHLGYLTLQLGGAPLPLAVAGHSLGEFNAYIAAGVLTFPEALHLVKQRATLMQQAIESQSGRMIAIVGPDINVVEEQVALLNANRERQPDDNQEILEIANYNTLTQVTLGGTSHFIEQAQQHFEQLGAQVTAIRVAGAFHTSLMQHAGEAFARIVATHPLREPKLPLVGNVTGRVLSTTTELRSELVAQMTSSVRWYQSVSILLAMGARTFIEVGPGRVLRGLVKKSDPTVTLLGGDDLADLQLICKNIAMV